MRRLVSLFLEASVYRQAPVESDLPERSVARVPALAPNAGLTWPPALPRPPRLLGPPEPIEVMALVPDYPPAAFVWRRVRRRVVRADGPERVLGEWWRADDERSAHRGLRSSSHKPRCSGSRRSASSIATRLPGACGPTMPRRPQAFGSPSDAVSTLRMGRRCWSIRRTEPPTVGFAGFCRSVRGGLVRELAGSAWTIWPRGAKGRLSFSCRGGSTTGL